MCNITLSDIKTVSVFYDADLKIFWLQGPTSNDSMVDYSIEILYGTSRLDNMNTGNIFRVILYSRVLSVMSPWLSILYRFSMAPPGWII